MIQTFKATKLEDGNYEVSCITNMDQSTIERRIQMLELNIQSYDQQFAQMQIQKDAAEQELAQLKLIIAEIA